MARLLIVDDEPDVLFLLEANVVAFGHEAVATADLQEARSMLEGGGFDALVLDVSMPVMDGPTFLRAMREEGLAPAEVFLLSAIPPEQLRTLAAETDAWPISKPFTSSSLRESLAPAFGLP